MKERIRKKGRERKVGKRWTKDKIEEGRQDMTKYKKNKEGTSKLNSLMTFFSFFFSFFLFSFVS